ncbi:MAG: cytochrome c3 family protein [bacterium]
MNRKIILSILIVFLILCLGIVEALSQERCLTCHTDLKQKMSSSQHFKNCTCISCHNPHTSKFKFLLLDIPQTLCLSCHKKEKESSLEHVHKPFKKGECLTCHDPHTNNLLMDEKALCFTCHKAAAFEKKVVHQPIQNSKCTKCHCPHASSNDFLLAMPNKSKRSGPITLCLTCHPLNKKLEKSHPQIKNISTVNCLSCHTPHSSDNTGLLFSNLHAPYEKKECTKCHGKTHNKDTENLCYTCHQDAKKRHASRSKTHLTKDKSECINCHNPHGAERSSLIRTSIRRLCTDCHDIYKIYDDLPSHPEVAAGRCSTCHNAHSSNNPNFFQKEIITLCKSCHEKHRKHCHPTGEKFLDQRDKKPITCITCHNPMGTAFKQLLRLDGSRDLCTQCHKKY